MSDPNATAEQWADSVAAMAVDALMDAGLVAREQFKVACAIVAEEIFVRLCCRDYPPAVSDATVSQESLAWRAIRFAEPDASQDGSGQ